MVMVFDANKQLLKGAWAGMGGRVQVLLGRGSCNS